MRAICTSASLQASTWVSPGFTLFRHSSPPFGSKQAHSNSTHGGPVGVGHFLRVHTTDAFASPFQYERSTGNDIFSLARLFDSLVRVSRRVGAPHFLRQHQGSRRRKRRFKITTPLTLRPFHHGLILALRCPPDCKPQRDNAVRLVLAVEMEVLPLSLSRLQVLCHSLSKVLFKLSLTLLVRYRSSYSVFNFGRHIPASLTLHSQTVLLSWFAQGGAQVHGSMG